MTGRDVDAGAPPTAVAGGDSFADAPIGRRAIARLVDFGLGLAVFIGLVITVSAASGPSPDGTGIMLVALVATFLIYLLYEVVTVALWGRTLGKQLMGLEVVRADDGGRPGLRRSFLRNLVPTLLLVGFFPLYPLPYLVAAIVKDHRWPNDRLAGTRVVARSR